MIPFRIQKEFPAPSLTLFVALQVLDVFTTVIGLHLGAAESSAFIGRLMQVGPVAALLIAKIFAVMLVAIALRMQRPHLVVFLNFWFTAIVSWNLLMILITGFRK